MFSIAEILVILGAIATIGWVNWYFLFSEGHSRREGEDG